MSENSYGPGSKGYFSIRGHDSWPDWSTAYSKDESPATTSGSNTQLIGGWKLEDDGDARIDRWAICFDTREFPAGAAISVAKITCRAKHPGSAFQTPVMDVIKLYRAQSLSYTPGEVLPKSDYGYIKNLGVYCGGLLITPGMEDWTECEIPLNAAGMSSVVAGDYTKFGIKADSDGVSSPGLDTSFQLQLDNALLVITYEAAGALKVVTLAATDVTKDSLTVNGAIIQGSATKRGFDWGVDAESLINEWYEEGSFGVEEFSHAVTGLTPGQEFCHRAKAC